MVTGHEYDVLKLVWYDLHNDLQIATFVFDLLDGWTISGLISYQMEHMIKSSYVAHIRQSDMGFSC